MTWWTTWNVGQEGKGAKVDDVEFILFYFNNLVMMDNLMGMTRWMMGGAKINAMGDKVNNNVFCRNSCYLGIVPIITSTSAFPCSCCCS
jgi:hypothetical protein